MKTNRMLTVIRLGVLGLLVAAFHVTPASAQSVRGKFTLPSTVTWGPAILPAGEYSFELNNTFPQRFTVSRGTHRVALIPVKNFDYASTRRCEMVLENGTVRAVSLPSIGMTFDYPAGKPSQREAPAKALAAQIVVLPVTGGGE